MTGKSRVLAASTLHSQDAVKVVDSEFEVDNHQENMMLLDPEDFAKAKTNTHSDRAPAAPGQKKLRASIVDEDRAKGGSLSQIPNDVDPAAGYLEQEAGMPIINNIEADSDDEFDDDEIQSEFEDLEDVDVDADTDDDSDEFVDADADDAEEFLGGDTDNEEFEDGDDLEDLEGPEVDADADEEDPELDDLDGAEADVALDYESAGDTDSVPMLDADATDDNATDDVMFAVTANVIHAMKGNRIIASMGPSSATKAGMRDVYLTDQFQQVVEATLARKGLRKGLVQSGFVLARVKLASASTVTAKVVKAKVEAAVQTRLEAMDAERAGLNQALAIAAVGVNRSFFKDAKNELRASLETEFTRMGVRGAGRVVRAMFARHGVSYAQELLALARKLAAMPEQVRDEYASALDLTTEDYSQDDEIEADTDLETEDWEAEDTAPPETITAALLRPATRSVPSLLKASASSAALSILNGDGSLL